MYKLKIVTNKDTWNNFITESDFEFYSFLQSWEWGEFQILAGKDILRLGIYNENELIGVMQIIKVRAKRAFYLFVPHGPLIVESKKGKEESKQGFFEVLKGILPELKDLAKKEKFDFIRFNSAVKNTLQNKQEFEFLGFINAPMHEHAEDTHLLNLTPSEDELLNNIKKGDRYYINRAIKEGVGVFIGNTPEQIEILSIMHEEHSKKVGYHPFSREFIQNLYSVFTDNITTISTRYDSSVESILMTIKFGKTCVYYIAASDIKSHKFSPNYLCQWEAIKKAKADGCDIYNFWGVSPDDNPKHPIAGVTKFKRKFAGYDYSLLHAQDLPLTFKYWFNYLIETIRRIKRGYYYKKPQ
ncbi:MAG: peptidoglycan bridge formation glycyltransferase FemA/FemB family protein [Candidatus Gracilibacteria bacterium]|nr:peptidoglycan bridge formation glycyltransferase FemA/FemB family protein [Candidatus Gracilibacteria bacterium]